MSRNQEIKLKYREEFRSTYGEAFQNWFEKLAVGLHGDDCFLAVRVTRGDGGLDGLVLKVGQVYQLYAPPSLGTDANTAIKVKTDFNKAMETLASSLKAWTFVHNSPDGKVGHLTAQALIQLKDENPAVCVEAIGIDGLWERLERLPHEKLASLFGISKQPNQAESQVEALLKRARNLANQDKRRKALDAMEQALALAETEKLISLQAEALIGLCLISSERRGLGDRGHYFQRLQSLQDQITEAPLLVMFHRARGAYLTDKHDLKEAESAYLSAIALASLPANAESCDEQLCVVRSEYVHLLCNANRTSEAEEHLVPTEAYAKSNPEKYDGEIFQAALNAGLHWAAKTSNEDAAIERIHALEAAASTGYLASRIAGQLINAANSLSHINCHKAALVAAEAALHLADRVSSDTRDNFLPGVLYTLAMVNFSAGRLEDALQRASSLGNLAPTPESAPIRFAAAQLVSVISRQMGDLATAVEKGELALELAPEVDSSFMARINLAEALADRGQTERALRLAQEAYRLVDGRVTVPVGVQVEILGHIANYSSQLGETHSLDSAMDRLIERPTDDEELREAKERYKKRAEANTEIRKRILDISLIGQESKIVRAALERVRDFSRFVGSSKEASTKDEESGLTLHQANALTIGPLVRWWEDTADDYKAVALDYDYWGRGCFAQILRNLQAFPHSLNLTIEVRTLEDLKQALRLWSLYTDFILLLWKGPTQSGNFLHLIDGEWFGPWGAGYILALGTQLKSKMGRLRFPALGYASWLPDDVAKFLVTEAKPFLASGRFLLVPASGVGCVSPGHGVMEQLLTEAANCIPSIQHEQKSDLGFGLLPYAVDIPLDILFDFVNETQDELLHMRSLLLEKTANVKTNGLQQLPKALELEIVDTLKRLRHQNETLVKKRNLSAAEQDAHIGIAPFHVSGHGLVAENEARYSPLLKLESMGYGWKIGASAQHAQAYRYAPSEGEAIGAWLAPPEPGIRFLTVKKSDE
jgi:tetratricopeptide (TPR) repeat protein